MSRKKSRWSAYRSKAARASKFQISDTSTEKKAMGQSDLHQKKASTPKCLSPSFPEKSPVAQDSSFAPSTRSGTVSSDERFSSAATTHHTKDPSKGMTMKSSPQDWVLSSQKQAIAAAGDEHEESTSVHPARKSLKGNTTKLVKQTTGERGVAQPPVLVANTMTNHSTSSVPDWLPAAAVASTTTSDSTLSNPLSRPAAASKITAIVVSDPKKPSIIPLQCKGCGIPGRSDKDPKWHVRTGKYIAYSLKGCRTPGCAERAKTLWIPLDPSIEHVSYNGVAVTMSRAGNRYYRPHQKLSWLSQA
jgi:hypothetical protein